MRKSLFVAVAAAGLMAAPASAQWAAFEEWDFCTANALSVCMNFMLQRNGTTDDYSLRITYVSTEAGAGQEGAMTSAGLYRGRNAPDLNVSNLSWGEISPSTAVWSFGSNQLGGDGPIEIEVAGNSDQGINNGLPVGGFVTVNFSSSNLATYDLANLGARSHIQGFGNTGCSLKPDSRADDNVVGTVASVDADCGTEVVPEPITMVLVGSGLLGLGGVQARRRRRQHELKDVA